MSNIKIPPAALEAGALATLEELDAIAGMIGATRVEGELTPEQQEFFRQIARAAFLAMVENWPEMREGWTGVATTATPALILPIMENTDAEAR